MSLVNGDARRVLEFIGRYINEPAWAEPLRMIAETLSEQTEDAGADKKNVQAGRMLIEMALAVDAVFAGELAQLCGPAVWKQVCAVMGERLRAIHDLPDRHYQECALAAMLATGSEDFTDILLPLLSSTEEQTRLHAYRLWPEIDPAILRPDWQSKSSHGPRKSAPTSSPSCFITASKPILRPSPPPTRASPSRRRRHQACYGPARTTPPSPSSTAWTTRPLPISRVSTPM